MTTKELREHPQIVRGKDEMEIRHEWGKIARRIHKSRENSALIVLLFGIGVLIIAIGLCTDVLNPGVGLVGGIASWVAAFVAREYLDTAVHQDTIEFDV